MTDDDNDKDKGTSGDDVGALWQAVLASALPETRQRLAALVQARAGELAHTFYREMQAHPTASVMLDHAIVNTRLHASMEQWLRQLFTGRATVADLMAVQRRTGEVHARIGVPMELISRGARILKRAIALAMVAEDMPPDRLVNAIQFVYEQIDIAVESMNQAYTANARRIDRSDEAYRLMFLGRDLRAERERQRLQLLEWAQQILVRYYWDAPAGPVAPGMGFAHSQFGLWITHKASVLFDDAPEIDRIRELVESIEDTLLPRLADARDRPADARPVVGAIHACIEDIKSLLSTMFDRTMDRQDGRDAITKLLNRRYLPTIAKREIELAQRGGGAFALLLVDIDHFARVRAAPGMETADQVLAQVADALSDQVRAGDFVFRIGDNRFCVLLVEIARTNVMEVADALRRHIAGLTLPTAPALATSVTVSVGVAVHDGHPDYQRLIERAEDALLRAKQQGRNRSVIDE
jgi:diguanylate cyclase